jgi:multidrug efflux system outer membrane protein
MTALAAETASAYVDLRGVQARLAAARANVAAQTETLQLTQALLAGGRATPLDVARARAQLEATQSAVPPLEAQVDADVAALDVLVGGLPREARAALVTPGATPEPAGPAFTGFPEDLLRRRPDIREAEARLAAASARVRAAKVDWWPHLSLVGTVSSVATGLDGLGERRGLSYSIGPQIDWPALDVRRNALRLEAARAGAEAQFLRYDKAVLAGVRDVETSLSALDAGRRAAVQAEAAATAAREAAAISRIRYREGVDAFFNVLDAERQLAAAEDAAAIARTRWALSYIALGRALGAGWSDPVERVATR